MTTKKIGIVILILSILLNVSLISIVYSNAKVEHTSKVLKQKVEVVEYQVGAKPSPITLPKQTPLSHYFIDDGGIISVQLPDGKKVYNIFEVATQAIEGEKVLQFVKDNKEVKNLIPRIIQDDESNGLTNMQLLALNWLEKNAKNLKDSLVWYYEFDNAYNDVQIKAPWSSAFGQAHVIKAFLSAYKNTGNKRYKDLAIKSAYVYDIPIIDGGFKSIFEDGNIFFEEVPTENPTHILNGHMVSTLALLELAKETGDKRVEKLAEQGVQTLKKYLHLYDTGYWSKYDLNPKKGENILRIAFLGEQITNQPVIAIDKLTFTDSSTGREIVLDVGRKDDFQGAWRISGTEWLSSLDKQGIGRLLVDGRSKHKDPVPGGTTMNSYIVFQIPEWDSKKQSYEKEFDIHIRVRYQDLAPQVIKFQIQSINEGNYLEFVDLPDSELKTIGDGKWKTYDLTIPSRHLGWYMGIDYQKYHVKLLNELGIATGDHLFTDVASQWETYITLYEKKRQ